MYVNGQLMATAGEYSETKTITVDVAPPSVLAINCVDIGGMAGILVSTNTGMVSDGSWRCSNTYKDGWNSVSPTAHSFNTTSHILAF
jgi:hypothetical protein